MVTTAVALEKLGSESTAEQGSILLDSEANDKLTSMLKKRNNKRHLMASQQSPINRYKERRNNFLQYSSDVNPFLQKSEGLSSINEMLTYCALIMLETFANPQSPIEDSDKMLTAAICTSTFYHQFTQMWQPMFDKQLSDAEYKRYVYAQIFCYSHVLESMGQVSIQERFLELLQDTI